MELKLYSDDDIRKDAVPYTYQGKEYPYSFISDVPGDNPDVLGEFDNHQLADRLTEHKAVTGAVLLDCETCCFYAYFTNLPAARAFIKKLNAYISQKARLIREAHAF